MHKTLADLSSRWLLRAPAALDEAESRVLQSAIDRRPISHDQNAAFDSETSLGDRVADRIAKVGGSWTFIIAFLIFLIGWTTANAWLLASGGFDPYPFVFLNLVLSMVAALQAPIIMMSQNRQSLRDRQDATHDYEVNLKAEIEIMALHEKLDELRHSEVLGMRDQLAELNSKVDRIETALASLAQPRPA